MKKVNDIYRNLPIPFFFLYPSNFLSPILSFTLSSFIVILDFWKFWIFRLYWGVFLLFYFFQHFSFLFLFFSIAKENCSWPYYFFFSRVFHPQSLTQAGPNLTPPPLAYVFIRTKNKLLSLYSVMTLIGFKGKSVFPIFLRLPLHLATVYSVIPRAYFIFLLLMWYTLDTFNWHLDRAGERGCRRRGAI